MKYLYLYSVLKFINRRNVEAAAKDANAVPHIGHVTEREALNYLNQKFGQNKSESLDILNIAQSRDLIGGYQNDISSPLLVNITGGPGQNLLKKDFGIPIGFIKFWLVEHPVLGKIFKVISAALTLIALAGLLRKLLGLIHIR